MLDRAPSFSRRHFSTYKPLLISYAIQPPVVKPETQKAVKTRVSTLMCPYAAFPYTCQLDTALIRGSATSTIRTTAVRPGMQAHGWDCVGSPACCRVVHLPEPRPSLPRV